MKKKETEIAVEHPKDESAGGWTCGPRVQAAARTGEASLGRPLHGCRLKPEAGWDGSGRMLTARSQRNREAKRKWERGQEKECEKEVTDAKDCGKRSQ